MEKLLLVASLKTTAIIFLTLLYVLRRTQYNTYVHTA